MAYIVAIDGTACSGKGTITKILADKLNITCIDSGIIYRTITVSVIDNGIDISDLDVLKKHLDGIDIDILFDENSQLAILNGIDVTSRIRTPEVNRLVSTGVAGIKIVRDKATDIIRGIAKKFLDKDMSIVMEGRDITSVIFPDALIKLYVDADVNERAMRRYKQDLERGIESTYEDTLKLIKDRDYADMHHECGALVRVDDAIYVDTTNDSIELTVNKILDIINDKLGKESI